MLLASHTSPRERTHVRHVSKGGGLKGKEIPESGWASKGRVVYPGERAAGQRQLGELIQRGAGCYGCRWTVYGRRRVVRGGRVTSYCSPSHRPANSDVFRQQPASVPSSAILWSPLPGVSARSSFKVASVRLCGVTRAPADAHVGIQDALATMDSWRRASEGYLGLQVTGIIGGILSSLAEFRRNPATPVSCRRPQASL